MKKILFLIDSLAVGGAEISVLEVIKNLQQCSSVVCVVYQGEHSLKAEFEAAGAKLYFLNIKKRFGFGEGVRELRKILKMEKPNLVHTTLFKSEIIGRIAVPSSKIPLVGSLISDTYGKERYALVSRRERLKLNLYKLLNRITAKRPDMYISVSKSIIKPNLKYLGIKESKVELIQNGRDVTVFEKARIYSKSEIIPDATSESLLIITNSRVIRSKGFDEMLLAFQSLSKKFGNIFLVVAGNGFDFDFYKNMALEMGLDGKVVFLGRRHDIPSLLKSCDLFWFASHYEGSPGVVIEGMLSKTPMILSDIEPVLENIQDRRHALIFKTGDAEDLAVKTEILIYDPEFGEKLASAAYELGSNHFDIKKLVNKQETLYLELIQQYENR